MSTERNPIIVIGWLKKNPTELTHLLSPIAEKYDVVHSTDDLASILTEDYSHIFFNSMPKSFSLFCKNNDIQIVSGSDGSEDGCWYFGFGIKNTDTLPVSGVTSLINELYQSIEKTIKNIDVLSPRVYNVIYWF